MSSLNLNNIRLVVSPITEEIYLARFGKDKGLALDKRLAENDVMMVLSQMCGDKGFMWAWDDGKFKYSMKIDKKK